MNKENKPDKELLQQQLNKCQDIEGELRRINELQETLLKTLPFGMEIVDKDGNILLMNEKLKEKFGKDAVGKKCWDLYKDDKKQCKHCPLREKIELGETKSLETEHAMGGKTFLITHTGMIYQGKEAIMEVFQDITKRKEAEESLKETMRIKSDFLSMASHEIRAPLVVIGQSAEFILRAWGDQFDEKQKRFMGIIERGVERLSNLVDDILDFQKIDAGKMDFSIEDNDLNEIVRDIYDTMIFSAEEKGLQFTLEVDDKLPRSKFNKDKIAQVLTNLVSNAIKFTDKGSVSITTGKGKDGFCVSVRDTGPGIQGKDIPRLFRTFEQITIDKGRSEKGTGLGLAISKEIIERHDGKIWADSEYGKGSTFSFSLPVK